MEMLLIWLVLNRRVLQEKLQYIVQLLGVLQWCLASSYHMILQSRYVLGLFSFLMCDPLLVSRRNGLLEI